MQYFSDCPHIIYFCLHFQRKPNEVDNFFFSEYASDSSLGPRKSSQKMNDAGGEKEPKPRQSRRHNRKKNRECKL